MAANQLDLIMSQVQQLSPNEQLQIIKRVADLLGRAKVPPRIEAQLAAMAADPNIQRELRQLEAKLTAPERRVDESHFRCLADQWRRETEHISSLKQACLHPAYQRIIGMGPAVVPYLLRELEQTPDHWFWALNAITEEDPAHSETSFEGARQAWLAWGREKGHL
jgi:hypothetical protein